MRRIEHGLKRTLDPARPVPDAALTEPRPPRLSAITMATESLPEQAILHVDLPAIIWRKQEAIISAIWCNGSWIPVRYMNSWFSVG